MYSGNVRARLARHCQIGASACSPGTTSWWKGKDRARALRRHVFVGKDDARSGRRLGGATCTSVRRNPHLCSPRPTVCHRGGTRGKDTKIRVVDDFEASRVNDLLSMEDTAAPGNLDGFSGMSPMFPQLGCARPLKACAMDFSHAYKHVGAPTSQFDFATIALPNLRGTPMVASLRTQPFGSSRAPRQLGDGYELCPVCFATTVPSLVGHLCGRLLLCGTCGYN